jgi:DUF971 family protein
MAEARSAPWPVELRVKRAERMLEIDYDDGRSYRLPAELLRVESPSAEVQGHGGEKTVVAGKREVGISAAEPVGNYAVRLIFDDGHDTGIYTWSYLRDLGQNQERLFTAYLEALAVRGLAR